jgi:hypothetical protein
VQAGYLETQGGEHADPDHIRNDYDDRGEKGYRPLLIGSTLDSTFILFNQRLVHLAARAASNQPDAGPQHAVILTTGHLLSCIDFT